MYKPGDTVTVKKGCMMAGKVGEVVKVGEVGNYHAGLTIVYVRLEGEEYPFLSEELSPGVTVYISAEKSINECLKEYFAKSGDHYDKCPGVSDADHSTPSTWDDVRAVTGWRPKA